MLRVLALGVLVFFALEVNAQGIDGQMKNKAQVDAASILGSKPKVLKIDSPHIKASTKTHNVSNQRDYGEAPLGLAWGIGVKDIKSYGVNLRAIDTKSFPNSYEAMYLPKPINELPKVILSFGDEDRLWRVVSYSEPAYDDDQALKGLYLYKKYYKLLSLKYGNAREFFEPKININEEHIADERDDSFDRDVEMPSTIGDKTFLTDMRLGEVSLYSTFSDGKIGVSLTLKVDETAKSYIVIEYKNSEIMQENYDETLKSL